MKNKMIKKQIVTKNNKLNFFKIFCIQVIAVTMLFSFEVMPQSVDSLINEALQNNPQLKSLQSRIKSADYRSETAGYLPPPTLGVEFSQVPINAPNPLLNAISQNISVSQMFMLGGKLGAMTEAERKNVQVAEKDFDSYKLKLISEIKAKYYEIRMRDHHIGLRDQLVNLLQNLLQSTEQLYSIGKAKYSDAVLLRAELASTRTQQEVLNNQRTADVYELNSLLGRQNDNTELHVSAEWENDSLSYSSEELVQELKSSNPELQKMDQMIEMNRLEITANKKELIPDLMLQGMIMRMPQGMFLTTKSPPEMMDGMGKTEYMYSLMASITLPFAPWSSGKISAKEEELNTSISGLASEKQNMENTMTGQLRSMLEKIQSSQKQITLYQRDVIPLYSQSLDAQTSEFRNGQISINDLINTMQMLLMKEEELSEAQMQHAMYLSELESMVGKKLF